MKVLFISNHFSFPDQPGAPRPWKVADFLVSQGYAVTIITNSRHYIDENITVRGGRYPSSSSSGTFDLIAVVTTTGRRANLFRRLLNYFSFSFEAFKAAKGMARQDAVIVGTPPLVVPVVGLLLKYRYNARIILEIRDLYPETARSLGKITNPLVVSLWRRAENFIRRRYDHIVTVVPRIRERLIDQGIPSGKMTVISNGFDNEHDLGGTLPQEISDFFARYSSCMKVVYGGGMGYGIHLWTVLEAAERCRDEKGIVFALFGEGEQKKHYQQRIADRGLTNVFLFPPQPRNAINEVFRQSDVLVHSFIKNDFFSCALPNKIFEYLGAGTPVIFAGTGDTADLINKAKAGIVVEPENPEAMAGALRTFYLDPEKRKLMGEAGREYVLQKYLRKDIFAQWIGVIGTPDREEYNTSTSGLRGT